MALPALAGPQAEVHIPTGWEGAVNVIESEAKGVNGVEVGTSRDSAGDVLMEDSVPAPARAPALAPTIAAATTLSQPLPSPTSSPTSLGKRTLAEYISTSPSLLQPPPAQRTRHSPSDSEVERALEGVDDSPSSNAASLGGSAGKVDEAAAAVNGAETGKEDARPGKGIKVEKGKSGQDIWVIESSSDEADEPPRTQTKPSPARPPKATLETQPASVDNDVTIILSDDESLPDDPVPFIPRAPVRIRKTTGAAHRFAVAKPVVTAKVELKAVVKPEIKHKDSPGVHTLNEGSDITIVNDAEIRALTPMNPKAPHYFRTPEAEPTPPPSRRALSRLSQSIVETPHPVISDQSVKTEGPPPKRIRIPIELIDPEDHLVPPAASQSIRTGAASNQLGAHSVRASAIPVNIGHASFGHRRNTPAPPTSDAQRSSIHSTPVTITQYTSPSKKGDSLIQKISSLFPIPTRPIAGPSMSQPVLLQGRQKINTPSLKPPPPPARYKSDISPVPSAYGRNPRPAGDRAVMQALWDAEVQKTRSARVIIVGRSYSDRTSVPSVPPGFTYLESEYFYPIQTAQQNPHTRFLPNAFEHVCWQENEICTIRPPRRNGWHVCSKQQKDYKGHFAYDEQGLFTFQFPAHVVIQECNRYCLCDKELCQFSVAQRRRKHELEVFETEYCGWGVRTAVDLRRGEVLGMYLGEFPRRRFKARRQLRL
ncbi:hypothetical protein CALCODRAFT_47762 [Calocera cornea HHB12733]|uniref:SET domain-containing protein n=1 Tax=Calocera cornea HHB12733 TaxID=1353952 RepID=A0A165DV77_9BASI|nr:hypothetical protein CALCODRAFT_47762 [Calocera cornea HHB12733]